MFSEEGLRGKIFVTSYDDGSPVRVLFFLCCNGLLVAGVDECCGGLVPLGAEFFPLVFAQVGESFAEW